MWITHVSGEFRHGLLEKSLSKGSERSRDMAFAIPADCSTSRLCSSFRWISLISSLPLLGISCRGSSIVLSFRLGTVRISEGCISLVFDDCHRLLLRFCSKDTDEGCFLAEGIFFLHCFFEPPDFCGSLRCWSFSPHFCVKCAQIISPGRSPQNPPSFDQSP